MSALLEIRNLRKDFSGAAGPVTALEGIDLDVDEGELAVIVGPSGCGKSTLLNIVAGLEHGTGGEARIDGHPITGPGADRGMVFQSYTLFPWLSVRENVEFGLRIKGVPKAERAETARRYLGLVGLADFENALPKELSGGMKQRVAIARVLANQPRMLLMDEPFGALDAQTRLVLQELLLRIRAQERSTVLFITHDIDEAILLADNVYVMSRRPGRLKARIPVDIPRPRDHRVTVSADFAAVKARIMELLWEEITV
ncbi:Bicarbonate transport ATP-binding protein CmpC [anaerobic digester metagenome]